MSHSSFRSLLSAHTVSDLPLSKGHVVTIQSNETPFEGFKKLIQHNILSAPVFDLQNKKYTGFLDMRDLVSFVVFVDDDQKSDVPANLHDLITYGIKLFKQPADGVTCTINVFNFVDLSRRNPMHPVYPNDTLLQAVEILAKGVHRVPVLNDQGEVINIISQSSIITFLEKHHNSIKTDTTKSIGEIHLGTSPVIYVTESTPAIEAFRLMDKKGISGVAVVNEHGQFIGNTSASDLKLFIRTISLELLRKPISDFLKIIRQESMEERSPTIGISTTDTIAYAIRKLASTKVHKLFVADDSSGYTPISVVSLTDILKYLMS